MEIYFYKRDASLEVFVFDDESLSVQPHACVSLFFCNFSTKLKTTSPWSLCIRRQRPVSCDYKVNAAASEGRGLAGGVGEVEGGRGYMLICILSG